MSEDLGSGPPALAASARPDRRRMVLVLLVAGAMVGAALPVYLWANASEWDGGRWSPDSHLAFGSKEFWIPVVVEYEGLAYAFSPIVSHGNITATGFEDGTVFDVVVRTFDGTALGPAQYVSNLVDNRSEFVSGAAVFEGHLFIATSIRTGPQSNHPAPGLPDEAPGSSIEFASFDGESWTQHHPIREAKPAPTRFEVVELIASNASLWAFWQEEIDVPNATFRARAWSGGAWGPELSVKAPTAAATDFRFLADGATVWAAWFNNATGPGGSRGVHLGRFNGSALDEVAQISDGSGETFPKPRLVLFHSAVTVVWTRADGMFARSFDGGNLNAAARACEGAWGAPVVYKDKLYVTSVEFGSFPPTWQWGVAAFDGARWTAWYTFGSAREGFEYPAPFVFGGKIYFHWIDGTAPNFLVHLRSYER